MNEVPNTEAALEAMCEALEKVQEAARRVAVTLMRDAGDSDTEPAEPSLPHRFTYTDPSGDGLGVLEHGTPGWLKLFTTDDPSVHLDSEAVNRLAQYLDGYRTDGACPNDVDGWGCAGTRNHAGPCSGDADNIGTGELSVNDPDQCARCGHRPHASRCREIREPECMGDECNCLELTALADGGVAARGTDVLCAGHFPGRAPDKTGCAHRKDAHGAFGCVRSGCPCERRGDA